MLLFRLIQTNTVPKIQRYSPMVSRMRIRAPLFLALALLSGCALRPEPISLSEHMERAKSDRQKIDHNYIPLQGPLSLAEAIARAVKYNYDAQLSKMEATLQEKQLDLALSQMLPRLAADAGYTTRDKHNSAESIAERSGQRSLDYSYSQERQIKTADVQFSWNILDIGVSYFQARQQGYRALIAVERRRKALDSIVKGVTDAYWRAAAANEILPKLEPLLQQAERILAISRTASERNLQPPVQLLDFQQNMIQVLGELRRLKNDLTSAKIQLASLINVPANTPLVFSTSPNQLHPESVANTRVLEDIGLAMRPELRIEAYQEKIDRQDVYKEIIKMMPGIGMLGSVNYDSNRLLYNNVWGELGIRATFNLVNLIQGPKAIAVAKDTVEIAKMRRLALSVALLTQINLSEQEYLNTLGNLKTAEQINAVGQQMGRVSENASKAGAQSESDRIRHQLTSIIARLSRERALAQVHTALANVYSSVGIDLVPANADLNDLPTLTAQIETSIQDWQRGKLPNMTLQATR